MTALQRSMTRGQRLGSLSSPVGRRGRRAAISAIAAFGVGTALGSAVVGQAVTRGSAAVLDQPKIQVAVERDVDLSVRDPDLSCAGACTETSGDLAVPPQFLIPTIVHVPTKIDNYGLFAEEHGGIPAYREYIRLVVTSSSDAPVVIQRIEPRTLSRREAKVGWYVTSVPAGCGGGQEEPTYVTVDLSQKTPEITDSWPQDRNGRRLALTATRTDPLVFDVEAIPGPQYVEWALDVFYTINGKAGTYSTDGLFSGDPFRITGLVRGRADGYRPDYDGQLLKMTDAPDAEGSPGTVLC